MATPKQFRRRGRFALIIGVIVSALTISSIAFGYVGTDQPDYSPGSVVTISGGNDSAGLPGYVATSTVNVAVNGPNGWSDSCSATVAAGGTWSCTVTLSSDPLFSVGGYTYTATSTDVNGNPISEQGTFTDADPHGHVDFTTTGLPAGTSVTLTGVTWTNNGTTHTNQTQTITAPGYNGTTDTTDSQSADPGTSFSFTFPSPIGTCTLTSQTSSPITTPSAGSRTTVTGNYSCATFSVGAGGPYSGDEGSAINLAGSVTGGGTNPHYAWTVDTNGSIAGDTAGDSGIGCNFSSATIINPTITCTDDSNGGYFTVTLSYYDDTHGSSGSPITATAHLTVNNVAPTVSSLTGDASVDENPTATHHYTYTISDPGSNDTQVATPSCGSADGAAISNATNTAAGGSFDCVFPDGEVPATTSTVSVYATDDDGSAGGAATQDVTVNNVNPTVAAFTPVKSNCSVSISSIGFSDPGQAYDNNYTGSIDWGDTNSTSLGSTTYSSPSFTGPFTHTYAGPGTYSVAASVTDGDGGVGTTSVSVDNNPTIGWPLAPILLGNGKTKSFNTGSAIPVKIAVIGCTAGLTATIDITPTNGTVKAKGKSNLDTTMRYAADIPGFIYNWDTTGWVGNGTVYTITISGLPGGTQTTTVTLTK